MSKRESNVPRQADAHPPHSPSPAAERMRHHRELRRDGLPCLMTDIEISNSLADLAGRIKSEHEAVATALKESVRHAIVAGELLIEAKGQVPHGQWLPWLRGL